MKSAQKKTSRNSRFVYVIIALLLLIPAVLFYISHRIPDSSQNSTPNKLVVTRAVDKTDNLAALSLTIKNAEKVKKLYDDIFLLPTFVPGGMYNCPATKINVVYTLTFYHDTTLINHAIYHPSGCASVKTDNSPARIDTGSFENDFQAATGLPNEEITGYQ